MNTRRLRASGVVGPAPPATPGLGRAWARTRPLLGEPVLLVASITVAGALLRLYHLGHRSLWFDEALLYWFSRGSFADVVAQHTQGHSAPPLYGLLVNLVSRVDDSEAVLRSASCLAGIASVPVAYLLARQLLSTPTAFAVALLVALAPVQVQYAQQLREYSLASLLAFALLWWFLRFLAAPGWRQAAAFTLVGAAAVFTQYGLSLLLLALNLALLACLPGHHQRRALLGRWSAIQGVLLLAVGAVYQVSLRYQLVEGAYGGSGTFNHLAPDYWDGSAPVLAFALEQTRDLLLFALPDRMFVFLLAAGMAAAVVQPRLRAVAAAVAAPALVVLTAACLRLYPYGGIRQDIFLLPGLYLAAGLGLEAIAQRLGVLLRLQGASAAVVVLFTVPILATGIRSSLAYLAGTEPEHLRPIVARLAELWQPDDRVYVYYGAEPAFRYYSQTREGEWIRGVTSREVPDRYLQQMDEVLGQPGRVWLVFSHCVYSSECDWIVHYTALARRVDLVEAADGAWLYLAQAGPSQAPLTMDPELLLDSGWSPLAGEGDSAHRWSNGAARLRIPPRPGPTRLRLRLAPPRDGWPVDVALGGETLARWQLPAGQHWYSLDLPARAVARGAVLEVRSPTVAGEEVGEESAAGQVGVAVFGIELHEGE